jgi:hypothetical protein
MKNMKKIKQTLFVLLVVALSGILTGSACDDIAEQCGLTCSEVGVAGGNASITGLASIDGFFGAVTNFSSKANKVSGDIDAELAAIAASVGMEGGAGADFEAEFQANLKAKFNLEGNIGIDFQPPRCEVSASASIEATAKCDVNVEAGSVEASCEGKCEVDPGEIDLEASCEGEATAELTCTGTAPNLACEGSCTGSCELEVAASCEGECSGSCTVEAGVDVHCSGSCSGGCTGTCDGDTADGVECEGVCDGECDASCEMTGSAAANCEGSCSGSCEMEAGGSCSGKCTGSCEYTPPSAECSGGAKAEVECKAEGSAEPPQIDCSGSCSGSVTPPSASAECEASAKAEAEVSAECFPPSVSVSYALSASGDVEADAAARAEFKAWLTGFKAHVGVIAAASAQAEFVVKAGEGIIDAAADVILNAAGEIDVSADPVGAYKVLNCLPDELAAVSGVITSATGNLKASVTGSVSLMTSLGK